MAYLLFGPDDQTVIYADAGMPEKATWSVSMWIKGPIIIGTFIGSSRDLFAAPDDPSEDV